MERDNQTTQEFDFSTIQRLKLVTDMSAHGLELNGDGSLTPESIEEINRTRREALKQDQLAPEQQKKLERENTLVRRSLRRLKNRTTKPMLQRVGVGAVGLLLAGSTVYLDTSQEDNSSQVNAVLAIGPVTTQVTIRPYNEVQVIGTERVNVRTSPVVDDNNLIGQIDPGTRINDVMIVAPANSDGSNLEYWGEIDCDKSLTTIFDINAPQTTVAIPDTSCYVSATLFKEVKPTPTP